MIEIAATIARKIGFASHQNAVPLIAELTLATESLDPIDDLTVSLSTSPRFIESRTWKIDRLSPGNTLYIKDRDVKLDGAVLFDLTESVSGEASIVVEQHGQVLAHETYPIELLARAEWGGALAMPELLPAFVLPNDPAVDRVLKAASDILRRAGKPDSIEGYRNRSRTRVWEIVSAIWSAIAGFSISYAIPPASFESQGQKIRMPSSILDGRLATCLDTALLFASAFEQAGLNSVVVLTQGHAFVGVWLQPQEFGQLITYEASLVRKRIALDELLVFETTLATQLPVQSFTGAINTAKRQLQEEHETCFVMAVDVKRARMQRIRPLALCNTIAGTVAEPELPPVNEAMEAAPPLPGFDIEIATEAPQTSVERIALWQRKLLDLTTRNRLLHLPDTAKALTFVCPNPAELEDRLADGKRIRLVTAPELSAGGRDAALYEQQTTENLLTEYAGTALERNEVLALLSKEKLEAVLIDLYRKARTDLEEGGANTLFLALGFLKWKKSVEDPRTYRAPLILLPVKLERRSAISGVGMIHHEDEPRFNLTLLELLKQDFALSIPGLDGQLPTDDKGIDVATVWNEVRKAVRDIPGFEVVETVVLSTFSFSKYLMWKDLADRSEALKQNPVVRHLIDRESEAFDAGHDFPAPHRLDEEVHPSQLFTPLPADSSQLAAIVASARGRSFVLDGPPGTGKSQTIANMIAHNLALGRRVLFVAEKRAALDVVSRRLEKKGLGEFCLELHSNKASKVDVLKQLDRAWEVREQMSIEEWNALAGEAHRLRDRLNAIVRTLHTKHPNGWTLHQAIGRVVKDYSPGIPALAWPEATTHDEGTMARFRDVVRRLSISALGIGGMPSELSAIASTTWSNAWQESLVGVARELPGALNELLLARDHLLAATKLPLAVGSIDRLEALVAAVSVLLQAYRLDTRIAFAPDFTAKSTATRVAMGLLTEYRKLESHLSVPFAPEAVRRVSLDQLDLEWSEAKKKIWPLSSIAKRRVVRALGLEGAATERPDPEVDLLTLRKLRETFTKMDQVGTEIADVPGWAMLASDTAIMEEVLELSDRIRTVTSGLADDPDHLGAIRRSVAALVVDANEILAPDGIVSLAHDRLVAALTRLSDTTTRLAALLHQSAGVNSFDFEVLRALAGAIVQHENRLKAWCDWRRIRDEAIGIGLHPLVDAVEANPSSVKIIPDLFEIGYARWFASEAMDAEPLLNDFVPDVHMSDIDAYRMLDTKLSDLIVRYVRARLCGKIPQKNMVTKRDGYGVLKHQLRLQRAHKPIRQLAVEMGEALISLAPCMLMSPLSIAQYLPAEHALFDLVIFDEASQIASWDAIGSIGRGKQVVVAGDPRQMPPTNFFGRSTDTSEESDDVTRDMESILDECLASGVPQHSLTWHYRSEHESLITFSNREYYGGSLTTFPAPVTRPSVVSLRRVDGVYAKGKGRTNQSEAEAIVAEIVARLTDPDFLAAKKTLAVITLNAEQQKLIEDLLDRARGQHPSIEPFFAEALDEPVVVKNLETIQGDERDLILISVGYGPTELGAPTMSMNFGPLNREGGWRRLNVAVTRARSEMVVFTSFSPSMIDLNRTSARAVRDLRHFLEFAERGPVALIDSIQGSVGTSESPFEDAVAAALRAKGWTVVPQIGVSRFRIDIGVVHPDRPGDYLVGVECDGASYHSAATARDRDKVRADILTQLGWKLVRVWSTDWWVDKAGAIERLHSAISAVLAGERMERSNSHSPPEVESLTVA